MVRLQCSCASREFKAFNINFYFESLKKFFKLNHTGALKNYQQRTGKK